MALLTFLVGESIKSKIKEYPLPHVAMPYFEQQYKISDVQAYKIATHKLRELSLSKNKDLQTYLNEVDLIRHDVIDARGTCDDIMMDSLQLTIPILINMPLRQRQKL